MTTAYFLATFHNSIFPKYAIFNHAYVPSDLFLNFPEMHFSHFLLKNSSFPPSIQFLCKTHHLLLYSNYRQYLFSFIRLFKSRLGLIHFYSLCIQNHSIMFPGLQLTDWTNSYPHLFQKSKILNLFGKHECLTVIKCFIPNIQANQYPKKHRPVNCLQTKGKIQFFFPMLFVSFFVTSLILKIYLASNIYFKGLLEIMYCFAFAHHINLFISSATQQLFEIDVVSIDYIKFELSF